MLNKNQSEAIAKHMREIASILENSCKTSNKLSTQEVVEEVVEEGSKRGRKPGAVSDDIRCEHTNAKDQRCKNRATKGTVCGKHTSAA